MVVDTGGIDLWSDEPLVDMVRAQAQIAVSEASASSSCSTARWGWLRRITRSPLSCGAAESLSFSAINKIDAQAARDNLNEYWELGLGEPIGVSAEHGLGVGDLLDVVVAALPSPDSIIQTATPIRVAIVGRPNVGKSSLVNLLLGDERAIVSSIPGRPVTPSTPR